MSSPLKHALMDHSQPAYRVAIKLCISEVRLSKIANGLIEPSQNEKKELAAILGKTEIELFLSMEAT